MALPQYVAFKDDNGNYLSARTIEGHPYLQFVSTNNRDPTVKNEVFTTHDGRVRIKSHHFGKFWRLSPNWIWADSEDSSSSNPETVFFTERVDYHAINLRNMSNNRYCKSLTTEGKSNCLNAAVTLTSRETRLEWEEVTL
uniref:Agglutinin domain-containing protein n=1 Tax=Davidia involucrata TaxID=16924 RepID=A0A5B7CAT4_DAVIN